MIKWERPRLSHFVCPATHPWDGSEHPRYLKRKREKSFAAFHFACWRKEMLLQQVFENIFHEISSK